MSTAPKPLDPRYEVRPARPDEAEDLLPLMRDYCVFYKTEPDGDGLREMARTLAADPSEGAIFIARERDEGGGGRGAEMPGAAVGFAAMGWKWSSLRGARVAVLEDLFCAPDARGAGVAEALIDACAELARDRGAPALEWVTATDNHRAQAVYDRVGADGSVWKIYELSTAPSGS